VGLRRRGDVGGVVDWANIVLVPLGTTPFLLHDVLDDVVDGSGRVDPGGELGGTTDDPRPKKKKKKRKDVEAREEKMRREGHT